jgi:hypothetical protein
LKPNEIQDLADALGAIRTAAVGYGLKFHLRVQLGDDGEVPQDVVASVNELLRAIRPDLELR